MNNEIKLYVKYKMTTPDGIYTLDSNEGLSCKVNIPPFFHEQTQYLRSWWRWWFARDSYDPTVVVERLLRVRGDGKEVWETIFHWPTSKLPH